MSFDSTLPSVTSPQQDGNFSLGEVGVLPVFDCQDDTSNINRCTASVSELDLSTPGAHAHNVTAIDNVGNIVIETVSYYVSFAVIPESPIGIIALMTSSLAALGAYMYRIKRKDTQNSGL